MAEERVFTHTVGRDEAGKRLDKLLGDLGRLPSRSFAARLLERGLVLVDGSPAQKRHLAEEGERLEVHLPPPGPTGVEAEEIPLDVRYEDEHLLVVAKPAGMVVHPAHGHAAGTLVNALLAHSDDLGGLGGYERPGIVHRLDKDTSGLMMVAKDDTTQAALSSALAERTVDRRYLALVHGIVKPDSGMVDAPVGRHPKDRMRMAVTDGPDARQAVTTFLTLERFAASEGDSGYSLLECKLRTGRTHQIRVHMAYIGHPVAGDPVYGRRKEGLPLDRQFLHAWSLAFEHPATGQRMELAEPLPRDLAEVLDSLAARSMGRTSAGDEVASRLAKDAS